MGLKIIQEDNELEEIQTILEGYCICDERFKGPDNGSVLIVALSFTRDNANNTEYYVVYMAYELDGDYEIRYELFSLSDFDEARDAHNELVQNVLDDRTDSKFPNKRKLTDYNEIPIHICAANMMEKRSLMVH